MEIVNQNIRNWIKKLIFFVVVGLRIVHVGTNYYYYWIVLTLFFDVRLYVYFFNHSWLWHLLHV